MFYFKKDLLDIQNNQKLLSLIVIGSLPIIVVGYFLYTTDLIYLLRNIKLIAWTTIIFGIVLYFADKSNSSKNIKSNLNLKTILYIGFFQTLALIPGTSRAGITITAGRFLKFDRYDSSKISFLLSIPALAGASALGLQDIFQKSFEFTYLVLIAITLSFLFSYFTVKLFLNYINKFSLNIFVIYRVIVGIALLIIIYN